MKLHAWALKNKQNNDFGLLDGIVGLFPSREDGRYFKDDKHKVVKVTVEIREAA